MKMRKTKLIGILALSTLSLAVANVYAQTKVTDPDVKYQSASSPLRMTGQLAA